MKRKAIIVMVGGLIFCLTVPSLAKMSAQEVINRMRQAYEQQMSEIDDLTMVTKGTRGVMAMMGESTIYQKRAKIAGKTVYKTRTEVQFMGKPLVTIYDGEYEWSVDPMSGQVKKEKRDYAPNMMQMWENLDLSQIHYLGTKELEGEKVHVLKIDNVLAVWGGLLPASPQAGTMPKEKGTGWGQLWINAKNWVLMRMLMVMTSFSEEGEEMTMEMTMDFKDYRQVKNMLVPYKITYQIFPLSKTPVIPEEVWVNEIRTISEQERKIIMEKGEYEARETKDEKGNVTEFWVKWKPVEDLLTSSKEDRRYVIDSVSGEIKFGNGVHGKIPLTGTANIRVNYRTGGGSRGNLPAYEVKDLKTSIKSEMEIPGLTPEEKEKIQMMQAFGGMMSGEVIVTKVEVNTGLSDDLFDGSKLKPGEPMFEMPQLPSLPEGIKLPPGMEIPRE